jgi:release factor glutamine methyltransferase
LYLQFERILTANELAAYRKSVQRRAKFEPVQYITGEHEFMGLTFRVTPDTLIPRPETEILVEIALKELKSFSDSQPVVLDVGTGSGAIAVSIAYECAACRMIAVDSSEAALKVAQENSDLNGISNITFMLADGLSFDSKETEKYHLVLANPPYISEKDYNQLHPQVRDYEPKQALYAGKSGTEFYQEFIPRVSEKLHPGGVLLMEIGYDQQDIISQIVRESGFDKFAFIPDYQQKDRILRVENG